MAAQPIYIESEEELTEVVDRLRRSDASEIPLVIPARARVGQSRFNFQLLRQYAGQLDKRLMIISADLAVQRMAQENGFTVFSSLETYDAATPAGPVPASALGTKTGPSYVSTAEPVLAGAGVAAVASGAAAVRPAAAAAPPPRVKMQPTAAATFAAPRMRPNRTVLYAGAAMLLLAGIAAMAVIVPSATVTLTAQAKPFASTANLTASPGSGPVRVRVADSQKSTSQAFKVTGQKITPASAAAGAVVWTNSCTIGNGFVIKSGERMSGGGQTFAEQGDLHVPAAASEGETASATGTAQAVAPGPGGNVPGGTIRSFSYNPDSPDGRAERDCLSVNNPGAMSGGADEQRQPQIDQNDYDAARQQIEQALQTQIGQDLTAKAGPGEKLSDTVLFDTGNFAVDHKVGDLVSSFTGSETLKGHGTFYNADDMHHALKADLASKVPAGFQLTNNRVQSTFEVTGTDPGGHLSFRGAANGFIAPRIDIQTIRARLRGTSPASGRRYLETLPVLSADIQTKPFALPLMPFLESRIDVQYVVRPGLAP